MHCDNIHDRFEDLELEFNKIWRNARHLGSFPLSTKEQLSGFQTIPDRTSFLMGGGTGNTPEDEIRALRIKYGINDLEPEETPKQTPIIKKYKFLKVKLT